MLLSRKKRIFHFLTSKRLFIITFCKIFFLLFFHCLQCPLLTSFSKISKYSSFLKKTSCRRSKKLLPLFTKMGKTSCRQSEKINSIVRQDFYTLFFKIFWFFYSVGRYIHLSWPLKLNEFDPGLVSTFQMQRCLYSFFKARDQNC